MSVALIERSQRSNLKPWKLVWTDTGASPGWGPIRWWASCVPAEQPRALHLILHSLKTIWSHVWRKADPSHRLLTPECFLRGSWKTGRACRKAQSLINTLLAQQLLLFMLLQSFWIHFNNPVACFQAAKASLWLPCLNYCALWSRRTPVMSSPPAHLLVPESTGCFQVRYLHFFWRLNAAKAELNFHESLKVMKSTWILGLFLGSLRLV